MKYIPLVVTTFIILAGIALFLTSDAIGRQERMSGEIYKDIVLKIGYTDTKEPKLFANVDAKRLAPYAAAEGVNTPSQDSMVLGATEARMMREEKLFTAVGDEFESFFGIRTRVGGILKPTEGIIDDIHFLSNDQFNAIDGEVDRVFILRASNGMPKLFYTKSVGERILLKLTLSEGSLDSYDYRVIDGKKQYPVLVGAQEAKEMRAEGLFTTPGDTIANFFGTNVFIAGVLAQTNTSVDMMHIIPPDANVK